MTEPLQEDLKSCPGRGDTPELGSRAGCGWASLTLCWGNLSVLLRQNRGNTGQELVPRSMNFWGEVIGIAGSHGAQNTVGKQL